MPGQDEPSDLYALLEPLVTQRPKMNPWVLISPGGMQYLPDYKLLEAMLFILRSTALQEPGTVERAIDMLRKLKAEADVYDGTCLLVAEWSDVDTATGVRLRHDAVPDDVNAARFLATLVDAVLERTPVEMHVEVRQRREHRNLPLDEGDTP